MFRFMQEAGYTLFDVDVALANHSLDYAPLLAGNFDGLPPNLLFSLG